MSSTTPIVTFSINADLLFSNFPGSGSVDEIINLSRDSSILSASASSSGILSGSDGQYHIDTGTSTALTLVLQLVGNNNGIPAKEANVWLSTFGSIACRYGWGIIVGAKDLSPSNGNSNQQNFNVSMTLELNPPGFSAMEDFRIHFSVCYAADANGDIPVRWCYIDPKLQVSQPKG